MDHEIRPLTRQDEPILWEMLYQRPVFACKKGAPITRHRAPAGISRYVEGWGRAGDTGFVAHDKKDGAFGCSLAAAIDR